MSSHSAETVLSDSGRGDPPRISLAAAPLACLPLGWLDHLLTRLTRRRVACLGLQRQTSVLKPRQEWDLLVTWQPRAVVGARHTSAFV